MSKIKCHCDCHRPGSHLTHIKPCCVNGYIELPAEGGAMFYPKSSSTPPLTEEREGNDQIHIVLADGVTARVSPNASPQIIEALTKMVDLAKVGFPSPQIEGDIWLNIDMPEYLKDGRDKGRFSWEQGYKAAEARYRNPPSSPTQIEERGEVPDEPFDFDGWVNEKFDERGRYKQALDEWAHYKCGVVDLYNDIEPVNKSLRKEISVLQSQLSEARAEAGDYRTLLEELVPPTNPVLMKHTKH